jgi:hypothetical protein
VKEEVMLKSIKRLLIVATVILAVSAPSVAYARFFEYGSPAGTSTDGQPQPLGVSSVPRVTASSSQGFQWGDAGIGAAGALVLVGAGAGVARRRRTQQAVLS